VIRVIGGEILNQYLSKEHYNTGSDNAANGGHKTITIRGGTASAGTAPLKFTSGTLLTTPEAGAMEFAGDNYYLTQTSGTIRKKVATYDPTGATGDIYYRDGSGYFTRLALGSTNDVLTVSSGLPAWTSTPTIGNGSTITIKDANFTLQDDADTTKQAKFQLSGITSGQTRTYTLPNTSDALATQTYVNTGGHVRAAARLFRRRQRDAIHRRHRPKLPAGLHIRCPSDRLQRRAY